MKNSFVYYDGRSGDKFDVNVSDDMKIIGGACRMKGMGADPISYPSLAEFPKRVQEPIWQELKKRQLAAL